MSASVDGESMTHLAFEESDAGGPFKLVAIVER
jgi:hypothetical protein